jgi:hypothetical protein
MFDCPRHAVDYRVRNYSLPGFILQMPTSQKEVPVLAVGSLAASTTSNQLDEPLVRLETRSLRDAVERGMQEDRTFKIKRQVLLLLDADGA